MLRVGELLGGDFQILRRLGGGGMGAVYLAHQRSTDALRAIKVMLPEWTAYEELVERFEQEARACGKIESDHVVKILAYGFEPERNMPWLVMEYLPGETLEDRVARSGILPPIELAQLLEQLFHGVGAAHRAGVVHRDLKPQNIYVAESQRAGVPFTVKILDFGIAKVLGNSRTMTKAMGTKAWMAPEQERSNAIITPAADVWALGLVTFWLLTGKPFWVNTHGNESDLSYEIFFDRIPHASQRAAQLGVTRPLPGFDTWFSRCVERDPVGRFPTADACWYALRAVLAAMPAHSSLITAPVSDASPVRNASIGGDLDAANLAEPTGFRTTAPSVQQSTPAALPRSSGAHRPMIFGGVGVLAVLGSIAAIVATGGLDSWNLDAPSPGAAPVTPTTPSQEPQPPVASSNVQAATPAPPRPETSPPAPAGMAFVPAGQFEMGMDDGTERHAVHRVTISKGFLIDQLEVSVRDYRKCVEAGRCAANSLHGRDFAAATRARFEPLCNLHSDDGRLDHPVNCVDRSQAEAYCAFHGKRLPTEAEWEYAARGGDGRPFPWGHDLPKSCGTTVLTGLCGQPPGTRPVGTRGAGSQSPFGALDMSGNVWEWVADAWDEDSYSRGDVVDPVVRSPSRRGVLRGGSWDYAPKRGRVAYRLPFDTREGNVGAGFRCAKDVPVQF